ncbi:type VI secretion system-associated FHA domain protein TagH [Vibrio variabilis]|uniref:type VI secretion system-associated FHA domain protein TagH n=1 Tax=Vibrio variabilis TaxID=990271 RepID=UPI000DDA55B1|nr:type VI secretion system-associated FHA domain protein TagH [Vibrio variabilis]
MILRLSVTSYHRFTSNVVESETLNTQDGKLELTLGRSENCDWVLSDPEKIISSYHARIELVNNSAYIYDMSTNGVFLNRSVEPIKKGLPQLITHGDVIAIGDYEIEAAISQHRSASATEHLRNDQAIQPIPFNEAFIPAADSNLFAIKEPFCRERGQHVHDQSKPQELESADAMSLNSVLNSAPDDAFSFPDFESSLDKSSVASESMSSLSPMTQRRDESSSSPENQIVESTQAAFFKGLGIDPSSVSSDNPERWWFQLGVVTRDSVEGIMSTLHNRSAFKQSTRINQTTFRRVENNPLKFSSDFEDAMHNLLRRRTTGFLPPEKAIKAAFRDLERHEEALHAGVTGAISALMKLLDPKQLEANTKLSSSSSSVNRWPLFSGNKQWLYYKKTYSKITQDIETQTNAFYMEDFAKFYEQYLKSSELKE